MHCPFCNKTIKPIYHILHIPSKKRRRKRKKKFKKQYLVIGYEIEEHKKTCDKYLKFKKQSNGIHSR